MQRRCFLTILAGAIASRPALGRAANQAGATFTNPIARRGADPWVIRYQNVYYYCYSSSGSLHIRRSERLEEIARGEHILCWQPPTGQAFSEELWAPELHRLQDRWIIYVAADDGQNRNHRMYALERDAADPMGPFSLRSKVADSTDRWAIDGTAWLDERTGRLYFLWSGWEGAEDVRQDLYIAPMSNPFTISGPRVLISRPEHPWESNGRPLVNEGPEMLLHKGKIHLIYSASGAWTDHYCLGRLTLEGTDPLDPESWVKHSKPVFAGTDAVISPGHASFTTSPDGREHWIVYHAARRRGSGFDRDVRMQRFEWDENNAPVFGQPIPAGQPIPVPSGSPSPALNPADPS